MLLFALTPILSLLPGLVVACLAFVVAGAGRLLEPGLGLKLCSQVIDLGALGCCG